jgi:predicted nucleotidyltransferase
MQELIEKNREKIAELCRQHHVRSLSVFGSAARDDFDPERSDVDLLVEFEELPYPASIDNYWSLEDALRELFARKVDLIRDGVIRNPYLLQEIRSDRVTVYAA